MTVTVHSPPPVTTGTPFPCPGAGTTARSAKENLNDAERAVVLRSELGIALLGALALNVAVQHSGDPLQDLVGEPGIVDGTSQRDRSDQRRQDERGIVWFACWRQADEQVKVAADLRGVRGPRALAAAGDVCG